MSDTSEAEVKDEAEVQGDVEVGNEAAAGIGAEDTDTNETNADI
jgi:hypothetical protein